VPSTLVRPAQLGPRAPAPRARIAPPRRPERTVLHRVVREDLESFLRRNNP